MHERWEFLLMAVLTSELPLRYCSMGSALYSVQPAPRLPRLQSKQVLVCVCVTSAVAICDLLSDTQHDMVAIAVIAVIVIGLYQVVQVVLDSGRR
jgi:hypothetical protein